MAAVRVETRVGPLYCHEGDPLTGTLRHRGVWESSVANFFRRAIRPDMTVVDVGANIGYFTVLASRLVGPGGRVHAVEPDPRNLELLERNAASAGNVNVHPVAAWDEDGEIAFAPGGESTMWSHVGDGDQLVPCARLETLITEPVQFVKIDTEGADGRVVRGMGGLLSSQPVVIAEYFARGPAGEDLLVACREVGYRPARALTRFGIGAPMWTTRIYALLNRDPSLLFNLVLRPR